MTGDFGEIGPGAGPARAARIARSLLPVLVLAAGSVLWAALPMSTATAGARPALIIAACCAAMSLARLALRIAGEDRPQPSANADMYPAALESAARRAAESARAIPWAQGMILAVVALEALHPSRPWHTAILGLILVGYLLALRLAETKAGPSALRRQAPLLVAGAVLAAISVGAAALPASQAGSSAWVTALAAVAAVLAAALVLPI